MTTTSLQKFIHTIQDQIAQGEIQLAIDQLQNYLSGSAPDLYNEVILLTARYNRLRRDERKGVTTPQAASVEQNKLINAVLELLEEIPRKVGVERVPSLSSTEIVGTLAIPDEVKFEKILGINNLKQIAWIEQGMLVAKSVCRILTAGGLGTGFLIGNNLLMTNNHVIPNSTIAADSHAEFNYQHDFGNKPLLTCRYRLDATLFHTNPTLDYTIVGIQAEPDKPNLDTWGHVLLNPNADPIPGEHVVIIQHPNGGPKQIAMTANQVVNLWEYRLQYTTDTMPGSSGSPVFNDMWQVIAIHHAGGDLLANAQGDKRFVNEGILMSAIKSDAGGFWLQ